MRREGHPAADPLEFLADAQGTLGLDLGVYGAPETYVIDKDGIIRHKLVGAVDEKVWREQLAPIYQRLVDEAGGK